MSESLNHFKYCKLSHTTYVIISTKSSLNRTTQIEVWCKTKTLLFERGLDLTPWLSLYDVKTFNHHFSSWSG